jgi:hypothetical protein
MLAAFLQFAPPDCSKKDKPADHLPGWLSK